MTVKIDFNERDIEPPLQAHLAGGPAVRDYIVAAVRYFNKAIEIESNGQSVMGFGDRSRFASYNTELRPGTYLPGGRNAGEDD